MRKWIALIIVLVFLITSCAPGVSSPTQSTPSVTTAPALATLTQTIATLSDVPMGSPTPSSVPTLVFTASHLLPARSPPLSLATIPLPKITSPPQSNLITLTAQQLPK